MAPIRCIVILNKGVDCAAHQASLRPEFPDSKVKLVAAKDGGLYPGNTDVTGHPIYVALLNEKATVKELKEHDDVHDIMPDVELKLHASWGQLRLDRPDPVPAAIPNRLTTHNLPGHAFNAGPAAPTGAGVCAYVVDSGCNDAHAEFNNPPGVGRSKVTLLYTDRQSNGRWTEYNHVANGAGNRPAGLQDIVGHGRMVCGFVAGSTVGVAPGAEVFSVNITRESFGGGSHRAWFSSVAVAIAEIVRRHGPGGVKAGLPAVVNLSLGFNTNDMLAEADGAFQAAGVTQYCNNQLNAAIARDIVFVAAAGNDGAAAANEWPCMNANCIGVGATNVDDELASFSNWGPNVDIYAPGEHVWSIDGAAGYEHGNGTSFSCPYVTGIVCLIMEQMIGLPAAPANVINTANVRTRLINAATVPATAGAVLVGGHVIRQGAAWPVTAAGAPQPFGAVIVNDRMAHVP